jgi:type IV pilus assembly protein PilM
MAAPRFLAVDCGAGHVACGVFVAGAGGRLILQQYAFAGHNPDPSIEAGWAAQTGQALGELATRHQLGGACAVALPGHLTLTKFVRTPAVAREKRAKIVEFEAQQAIPHALDEVVWDHVELADDGIDLDVMLAAVKRDVVEPLFGAIEAAGFSPERFAPSGLALQRAFAYNYPEVRESVILAGVGARSTQLLFIERQHLFVRTLALGGNTVTQHIADELKLDFAQAESLKLQVLTGRDTLPEHSPARTAVRAAAAAFAGRLQQEIARSSAIHRRQSSAAQPVAVYLAGGGALIPELPAQLAEKLQLRVERFDPLRAVEKSPRLPAAALADNTSALTELVGLATALLDAETPAINLLPPDVQKAQILRRRQPWLLAAATLATCLPLPFIWHYHQVGLAHQAQDGRLEARLAPLRQIAAHNADNLARIEAAQKQIAALQGVVAAKSSWLAFLADLQTRLAQVDNVWLDALRLVPLPDTPDAATNPPADGSTPAATAAAPLRLTLTGRLLDRRNPLSKVSPESYDRVKQLFGGLAGVPFVAEVRDEQFDATQPGILRFECTVVVNPKHPLL